MFQVTVKWKSGDVTHDTCNDPYRIGKRYSLSEIEDMYKGVDGIEFVNIVHVKAD